MAFNPFDGAAQSLPYHIFPMIYPIHKWTWLAMFIAIQIWTISIHDRLSLVSLDGILNGSAHHACHHMYFNYNYGQYFTLWDKVGGTHRSWDGGPHAKLAENKNKKLE